LDLLSFRSNTLSLPERSRAGAWIRGMMRQLISRFVGKEVAKRWSLLRTAALITLRPSAFSERIATEEADVVLPSSRFFLMAVGIVLANEALFSVAFETAFSDLVHHSFPVFVALTGGAAVYLILKLLFTRGVHFNRTVQSMLYVGGAALIFMVTAIFGLLAADFSLNFGSVIGSGFRLSSRCQQRLNHLSDEYSTSSDLSRLAPSLLAHKDFDERFQFSTAA
jgi:hypothetical protein